MRAVIRSKKFLKHSRYAQFSVKQNFNLKITETKFGQQITINKYYNSYQKQFKQKKSQKITECHFLKKYILGHSILNELDQKIEKTENSYHN